MRSSLISMLIAIFIVGGIIFGGFLIYKRFSVSADVMDNSTCSKSDVNADGKVNSLDLNSLIKAVSGGSTDTQKYDINSDGTVNSSDTESLNSCWSKSSSSSAL